MISPIELRKLIDTARVEIRHATKTGNDGLADKITAKLRNRLDDLGYNWKRDPDALELLCDYVTESNKVKTFEECNCEDKKEPKSTKIPKSISKGKEEEIEDYYGGYDDKKDKVKKINKVKKFEEYIVEASADDWNIPNEFCRTEFFNSKREEVTAIVEELDSYFQDWCQDNGYEDLLEDPDYDNIFGNIALELIDADHYAPDLS